MKSQLTSLFLCAVLSPALPVSAQEYPVDDSYTPSERFDRYSLEDPSLKQPVLSLIEGQQILFERKYKTADGRHLHTDVFLPPAGKKNGQAILFVHGGGWRSGNKSHFYPLANLLAQRGYAVFTPEYRLSIEAQYPAGMIDLNDAIVWAKAHADEFGFEPAKLAIGGGSSGGHMAALIGNTANEDWFKSSPSLGNTRVNAVIDLDGVLDFTHPLAIANENQRKDKSAAGMWFGGAMEDTLEKWQQASTARHIHAESPPMLIISSGQLRFTAGKDTVLSKLNALGIAAEYFQHDEIIHTFWLFEPYLSHTASQIDRFLSEHALTGVPHANPH